MTRFSLYGCKLGLSCALLMGSGAIMAADPDYTVKPDVETFELLEPGAGVLTFTITNLLDKPLTIGGYAPYIDYLFGDPTDGFYHSVLGTATPYVIAAKATEVVPVFMLTDLEVDDPEDQVGGHWVFALFPEVFIGQNPRGGVGGLPFALGTNDSAEVIVRDVPEPTGLVLGAVGGLMLMARVRLRRRAVLQ